MFILVGFGMQQLVHSLAARSSTNQKSGALTALLSNVMSTTCDTEHRKEEGDQPPEERGSGRRKTSLLRD